MPLEIQPNTDNNILIIKVSDPFDMKETIHELNDLISEALDNCEGMLNYVSDIRDASISFGDMVSGMGLIFKGGIDTFSDPRLRMIVVSDNPVVKMGSKAASQQSQYGKVPIKVFATVEDAVAYARSQPNPEVK